MGLVCRRCSIHTCWKNASIVVQSLSHIQLFATPWTAARYASLSFTISQSLLTFMSIQSVMLSNHLILCYPLIPLPSIFPSIRVFSNDGLFQSGSFPISSRQVALVLELQHQSFQWTWIWANSRRWWRTGNPHMLQSVGSQRIRHDLTTEQQQLLLLLLDTCIITCMLLLQTLVQ